MNNSLENARLEINEIDKEMAALFERRMKCAKQIAEYKKEHGLAIEDKTREILVIEKNSAFISDDNMRKYYVSFLENLMQESKNYQQDLIEKIEHFENSQK